MKKIVKLYITLIVSFIIFFFTNAGFGQSGREDYIPDISPIPPNAMEFLKYGEVPVSEYTGIPEISIPIYTIKEGDLEIPVKLTYHAGGIRVKEEAGWVGLGWSLNFGNITQIVNDRDDFGNFVKILPDYYDQPIYYGVDFAYCFQYPFMIQNPCPYTNGIVSPSHFSYLIFTDYFFPINGDWIGGDGNPYVFNGAGSIQYNQIDSEPDVFKASFFGHNLDFMFEFGTNNLIILNEKGYKIFKENLPNDEIGWKIVTPDGNKYYFRQSDYTYLYETNYQTYGTGYSLVDDRTENRTWYITSIETFDNRNITFNYLKTDEIENMPTCSQTWWDKELVNEWSSQLIQLYNELFHFKDIYYFGGSNPKEIYDSHSRKFDLINLTRQTYSYLTSIEFTNGRLDFVITNDRADFEGTYKLNSIKLLHNNELLKTFSFNYGYFTSDIQNYTGYGSSGNGYFENKTEAEMKSRLKLESLQETGFPAYLFVYNSQPLPDKTSFWVDYWGFYNGKSNSSFLPNPYRFDITPINNEQNTDNHSARLEYTKATVLEKIVYPTGGFTTFDYGLHWFNNYFVPDFDSLNNIFSKGEGLRIESINDFTSSGEIAKNVLYHYKGGKAVNPLKLFVKDITYKRATENAYPWWTIREYHANQSSSNNYYVSSLFGSGNYIGYDEVTVEERIGFSYNGKIVSYFVNNPDIVSNGGNHVIAMPSIKKYNKPNNGLLIKEMTYDKYDNLKKEDSCFYHFDISNIYYGIKTGHVGFLAYTNYTNLVQKEQNIAGCYPIFSGKSILDSTQSILFFTDGSLSSSTVYTYNNLNLLHSDKTINSKNEEIITTYFHPNDLVGTETYMSQLTNLNRLKNVIILEKRNNGSLYYNSKINYFIDDNSLIMPHIFSEANGENSLTPIIRYDDYDIIGNLLEFHKENNLHNSYYWGYNNQYPIISATNLERSSLANAVNAIQNNMESFLESLGDLKEDGQRILWKTFNNNLRGSIPGAMITSYTFKPLVGMTSETDPAGKTTYYEYDDFGRLVTIKDQDGKVIKHIDYHYAEEENE